MLNLVKNFDKNASLTANILCDPNHAVPQLLIRLYSLESFLYGTLNKATRFGDTSKFESLGPYAQCMDKIVKHAIEYRKEELNEEKFLDLNLFRGSSLNFA